MRKYSKKRAKQNLGYGTISYLYITEHPLCEACGSWPSCEIHHMKGRIGDNLTNTKFFLAVCRLCHIKIENNPAWAREQGYSLSRLSV